MNDRGRPLATLMLSLVLLGALLTGCSAPAATPTAAPTKAAVAPAQTVPAPTKAAQPTAAAQAAPTTAKKLEYPESGKSISIIVPWAAGANADLGMRVIASALEKDLSVPIQVVNKAGASGQVGATEALRAKADGYTVVMVSSPAFFNYLEADRKATYTYRDFAPIAMYSAQDNSLGVRTDSPYKTAKDLVDAAKAKPGSIKIGTPGLLSGNHLAAVMFQQVAGVKFSYVHFDGGAPAITALLGGHVDVVTTTAGIFLPQARSGEVRLLGVLSKEEHRSFPGVKTMEAQGYKVYFSNTSGVAAPGGTPKEIVDLLGGAIKKALDREEIKRKLDDELGLTLRYMNPAEYGAHFAEMEPQMRPLLQLAKSEATK